MFKVQAGVDKGRDQVRDEGSEGGADTFRNNAVPEAGAPTVSSASSAITLCRRPTLPLAPRPIAHIAIIDLEAHSFLVRPRVVQLGMKDPKASGMNELVQLARVMAG